MNISEVLVVRAMNREITPELMDDLITIDSAVKVLIFCPTCKVVMDTLESVLLKSNQSQTPTVICGGCFDKSDWIEKGVLKGRLTKAVDFRKFYPTGERR